MNTREFVEKNLIYECVAGSHAYGFATSESDLDLRGITIPPIEYVIGLENFEQQEFKNEDRVIYGLKKFIQLAANCNPNIIEILYMPEKHIKFIDKAGQMLLDNAELFLSKKAKFTFSGYAFAQLKRIKMHKKWIDNPPEKPNPKDYVVTRYFILKEKDGNNMPTKVSKELYDEYPENKRWTDTGVDSSYEAHLKHYKHYCEWRKNRNPKRAEIEEKYKYDTKHSTHLVRLLRMGVEILEKGEVLVDRKDAGDADDLIAIRNGSMTYEEIVEYAEYVESMLDDLYNKSKLRHSPDRKKINELYMNIVSKKLGIRW